MRRAAIFKVWTLIVLHALLLAFVSQRTSAASSAHTIYLPLIETPLGCTIGSATWQTTPVPIQTGSFTLMFDAKPNEQDMDGVIGLSAQPVTEYRHLAVITRFNAQGFIDARSGSSYQAASQIPYDAGITYRFRLAINIPTHTYDIFVTPDGQAEQTVGTNFAFRTEQSTITSLGFVDLFAAAGSHEVCNVWVS